jgi:eukaryotic-like serine/threonine-protein kinase
VVTGPAVKLVPGQVVERYTVEGRIGKGGMAQVYRVRHDTLGSVHALKVLRVHGPMMKDRLVLEGKLQASLRHPNIVAVTDVVSVEGNPALVMDYVEGPALDEWLQQHRPDLAQAEAIFRGILAGVSRAHRLGLVHRDLKPGNVLMAQDEDHGLVPKVADFGLAKLLSDEVGGDPQAGHTQTGSTMGTPAYMAPEQVRDSKSVDQRADIFALGCILYELCTGASPFYHPDLFEIFNALASGSYVPPKARVPDMPERIANAITGSLATQRDSRINSCSVLLKVLDGTITEDWAHVPPTEEVPLPARSGASGSSSGGSRSRWEPPPTPEAAPAALRPAPRRPLRLVGGLTVAAFVAALVALGVLGLGLVGVGAWYGLSASDPLPAPAPAPIAGPPDAPAPAAPEPPEVAPPEVELPEVVEVAPAPHPVAGPAPAPAPAGAPAETAAVAASGEADEVWLEAADGRRVDLGDVPAGTYRVMAGFKGQAPASAGRVTVRAGEAVTLSCSAAFQICQAR